MARVASLLLLGAMLVPSLASAHQLKVFASRVGGRIEGRVYFVGGSPAITLVKILPSDGSEAVLAESGADGRFSAVVAPADSYRITANVGDGHVANTTVGGVPSVHEPATAGSALTSTSVDMEAIVARQILPLREELAASEERIRLRDVLGGLGYIAGLVGLVAWWSSRRVLR